MTAQWARYRLKFHETAITSREKLDFKDTYYLRLSDARGRYGYGECALFRGLSCDDVPDYEAKLSLACQELSKGKMPQWLNDFPSIEMGVHTALRMLQTGIEPLVPDGIKTNGLVWMGTKDQMTQRAEAKSRQGFDVIKMKIGALEFDDEVDMLRDFRALHPALHLRLDANGAFSPSEALEKLTILSAFNVEYIEQPIRAGQRELMREICEKSPIPIALDEELIGLNSHHERERMITEVRPTYIIIKPALVGCEGAKDWANLAHQNGCGLVVTSALESSLGLYGVAQLFNEIDYNPLTAQGLGLGNLYENNLPEMTYLKNGRIFFKQRAKISFPSELVWNH